MSMKRKHATLEWPAVEGVATMENINELCRMKKWKCASLVHTVLLRG